LNQNIASDILKSVPSQIQEAEVLSIAKDLIRIPSPTESEAAVTEYVSQLLGREGFEVVIQEVSPGRPQVIGRLRGTGGGKSLMLNGHSDNDAITESWQWNPYEPRVEGNRLWGAGIRNMKPGLAAMLAAAITVKRLNIPLRGDLIIACVVGELQGGKGTIHLVKNGIRANMAVVPEPYSTNIIITKCVGVHKCAISTIGKSIHTSRSELGVDAIQQMLKVIERQRRGLLAGTTDRPLCEAWMEGINVACHGQGPHEPARQARGRGCAMHGFGMRCVPATTGFIVRSLPAESALTSWPTTDPSAP
jgi:acetylornithine deacetylase